MAPGEILKEIRLPDIPPNSAAAFIKLGNRKAMFIAVVSVAARLTIDNAGRVQQARLALGAVAPTPLRVQSAEELLCGHDPSDDALAAAAHEASRVATPISDTRASAAYRRSMVEVLATRALRQAVDALRKDGTCDHA
jgi:carbon-monoxide dehydrogenase medium subunit